MATLNYKLFATPGRQCHRAHYSIVHKKAWWELSFLPSIARNYSTARKCLSRQPHAAAAIRGGFFDFIYVIIDAIGTYLQNFIKIDRQKNQAFFN